MKIEKNKDDNFIIELTAKEMNKFLDRCYKPYHESSIRYFQGLYDTVGEKVDSLNGVEKKSEE
jgi:hypothetical protein